MRYKIIFSYDGSDYFGYAKQPNKKTIQGEIIISKTIKKAILIVFFRKHSNRPIGSKSLEHFDKNLPSLFLSLLGII